MQSIRGYHILIILSFLFFLYADTYCQNNTDSLIVSLSSKSGLERYQVLTKIIDNYLFLDADKSIQYSKEALKIATEFKDEDKIAFAHRDLGYGEYRRNNYPESLKEFDIAEEMYAKLNDGLSNSKIKDLKAIVYMSMKRYDIALNLLNQVMVFNYEHGMQSNYVFTLLNISNIFLAKKEYDKALEGYLKILASDKENKTSNRELIATLNCNIGEVYYEKGNYELSYQYRKTSLDMYKKIELKDGIANLEADIGSSLIKLKDYELAKEYLNLANEDYKSIKFSEGIENTLEKFATLYLETNQFEEGLSTCKELENLCTDHKDSSALVRCINIYAQIYSKTGNYKLSNEYFKRYIELDELIDSRENKQSILELETAYLTEEKTYENKVLRKENDLQKEKLAARESLLIVILGGVIISIVLMILLILKEKRIRLQNKKLGEHINSMDKLFSIISHDLRSPFLGFAGLTGIMAEDTERFSREELSEMSRVMHKSINNLLRMLTNLLDWARLKQGDLSYTPKKIDLYYKISENLDLIKKVLEQKQIEFTMDIPNGLFVSADEEMLNSILRNLLSNAIKFTSNKGNVSIRAKESNNSFVEIAVADNGIGIPETIINKLFMMEEKVRRRGTQGEESTGLGLLLVKDFVEKHGGTIRVESKEGEGSTFYFTIHKAS